MVKKVEQVNKSVQINTARELSDYRVRRLKRQEEMMRKMTTRPSDSDIDPLFNGYPTLLTVSALVAYSAGLEPFKIVPKGSEPFAEPVQVGFFSDDQLSLIDLIAYAHTHEPLIIRQTRKFDIFSGYAAVGFDRMCQMLDVQNVRWERDSEDVLRCGKKLADWYLRGSECFSVTSSLLEL